MKAALQKALLVLTLALVPSLAWAQQFGTVQGRVLDGDDQPLPGVNVVLRNTNFGTVTDIDGRFTFDAPAGDYTLSASFVGYITYTVPLQLAAGETKTVAIELEEDLIGLEEVVVLGYQTVRKREATGSISTVTAREIQDLPVQSFDQAIQGRAAGVQITSASGAPGGAISIRIRGVGSINAGNEPLYIIDGVQVNSQNSSRLASQNPLASINPNDIESIEVLKDVAAASIYGAQAANGVVLVTTKQGLRGRTRIEFTAQAGSRDRIKKWEVLDANQYAQLKYEALRNYVVDELGWTEQRALDYATPRWGDPNADNLETYDWQDAVYQTGTTQQYDLSVSGGDQQTRFYLAGSFTDTQGQVIASAFKRGTLRANLEHNVRDNLQIASRINLSTIDQRGTVADGPYINSPFFAAMFVRPDRAIYTEDGEFNNDFTGDTFGYNLVQMETYNDRFSNLNQLIGNLSLNWEIAPNLFATSIAGLSFVDTQEDTYNDPRIPQNSGTGGSGTARAEREANYNLSQTINYAQTVGEVHNFRGLGGVEYKRELEEYFSTAAQQFPNELFRTLQSAAEPTSTTGYFTEWRQLSFFGNGNYSFDDKYLLSGTVRYDGNSRFGEDRRWGLFGSASAGWRISAEPFMAGATFVDDLKLRLSYGVTGNNSIGNFASRRLYGSGGEYLGRPGIRASSLGNNLLTWEEAWETNAGLDYSFFRGRVSGALDAYIKRNEALLLNRPLPGDSGFGSLTENVGTVENRGIEFEISTINIDTRNFTWSTDFNISFVRNEVVELVGDDENIGSTIRVGEPLGANYYWKYAGVNPADGRPFWYDAEGNLTYTPVDDDRQVVGNSQPSFYGGAGTTLAYAGLSLEVFFQYDYGRDVLNNDAYFLAHNGWGAWNSAERIFTDAWREPGQVTDVPRPHYAGSEGSGRAHTSFNSFHVEDASYIRLKNIRLDYQLPTALTQRSGLRSAAIFAQAQNLLTWTNYSGLDPEIAGRVGMGAYPQAKTFTAGLRVGL